MLEWGGDEGVGMESDGVPDLFVDLGGEGEEVGMRSHVG